MILKISQPDFSSSDSKEYSGFLNSSLMNTEISYELLQSRYQVSILTNVNEERSWTDALIYACAINLK